jgi:hypothetical protein
MNDASNMRLSRISKLFVDGGEISATDALARREQHRIILRCGADVAQSRTLQLAVLTAANIAGRCFPGAVRFWLDAGLAEAPLLVWPRLEITFSAALAEISGAKSVAETGDADEVRHILLFGTATSARAALRVTFDGWVAKVGPAESVERLQEREFCALAGTLAGALAISEVFLSFACVNIEAARRIIGLSLWRLDLPPGDPGAIGVPVQFLPSELWILGLGHLGNAYLWALAALPYSNPLATEIYLNDFDIVEPENFDTGMIFDSRDVGALKTRACGEWLERRGFRTRLIERPFDSNFRCRTVLPQIEPRLALCGFDSNRARRDLKTAGFLRVMESGLGGTKDNFDTITFHALPNPRPVAELWPDLTQEEQARQQEHFDRVARESSAYAKLRDDVCGRAELVGKSVAVPFVGAIAATLVLAEVLRLLHGGPVYTDIKIAMSDWERLFAETTRNYGALDLVGLRSCDAAIVGIPAQNP